MLQAQAVGLERGAKGNEGLHTKFRNSLKELVFKEHKANYLEEEQTQIIILSRFTHHTDCKAQVAF